MFFFQVNTLTAQQTALQLANSQLVAEKDEVNVSNTHKTFNKLKTPFYLL